MFVFILWSEWPLLDLFGFMLFDCCIIVRWFVYVLWLRFDLEAWGWFVVCLLFWSGCVVGWVVLDFVCSLGFV